MRSVNITPRRDLAMIAVQGPNAREQVWAGACPAAARVSEALEAVPGRRRWATMFIARTGYTGEDGFEIMLPATGAPCLWKRWWTPASRRAGLGARDTLRLEAGMNLYGQDMDETLDPLESGLAWTVDLKSRARLRRQGGAEREARRRASCVGLVLLDKGVLRSHQKCDTRTARAKSPAAAFRLR